jgi:hypothetical protein
MMKDGKLYSDLYHVEHSEQEQRAEQVHQADVVKNYHWYWTLGFSKTEQVLILLTCSIVLALVLFYAVVSFIFF